MKHPKFLSGLVTLLATAMTPQAQNGTWSPLGPGLNNIVNALAVSGGTVYAGGQFKSAGGVTVNYIAQWDGTNWSPLGSGMNGLGVYALAVPASGELYAGGEFTTAGSVKANYIAKWNGSNWSALASGMGGYPPGVGAEYPNVAALTVSGNTVYAGGPFTTAGGIANVVGIAQWNDSSWSALGAGIGGYSGALAIAVAGGAIYAAGNNAVYSWNGSSWSTLGSVVNGRVGALAVLGNTLYVGGSFSGSFTTAGGIAVTNIAQWNGSSWSALGPGLGSVYSDTVDALAVSGGTLYAGGGFTNAGEITVSNIAQWNGSTWSALGSGVSGTAFNGFYPCVVSALAVSGNTLYVAGNFTNAGGIAVNNIAQWTPTTPPHLSITTTNGQFGFTNQQFQFTLSGPAGSSAIVQASTDLQDWIPVATNTLGSGSLTFTDVSATNFPQRFYRAKASQ